jgi:maleylpyruvate isomerase
MDLEPGAAIALCKTAHQRLLATASGIDDQTVRRASLLPGWTVGHVLTHIARNADGHSRRLEAALQGREVARYPGGSEQRNREIEQGAGRPAQELVRDVGDSAKRLEDVWAKSERAGWPNAQLLAGDRFPTSDSPIVRLREVEVHHVDLALGYDATDWPDEYLHWELPLALAELPKRIADRDQQRRLLAWLIGRSRFPEGLELKPWL